MSSQAPYPIWGRVKKDGVNQSGLSVTVQNVTKNQSASITTDTTGFYAVDLADTTKYPSGYNDGDGIKSSCVIEGTEIFKQSTIDLITAKRGRELNLSLMTINVDAVVKASGLLAAETTYNIQKDASITSSGIITSQSIYNLFKDAVIKADEAVLREFILNIFADAMVRAETTPALEFIFNILKDAPVKADATVVVEVSAIVEKIIEAIASVSVSATSELQSIFNILKNAEIKVSAVYTLESFFNLYPDAEIYATAIPEVSIGVVRKTKIFLIIGNMAIQLSGD